MDQSRTKDPSYFIGVDLGGTKILTGVFNQQLDCVGWSKKRTKPENGPEFVVGRILDTITEAVALSGLGLDAISAIGIGSPGSIDRETGVVKYASNLGWYNVNLASQIQAAINKPVVVDNDCNCCVVGIHAKEFNSKAKNLIGIFIGTGIGCGIIIDGKLYSGSHGFAGEVGHIVLDDKGPVCSCGRHGCFEAYASRNAIINRITSEIKNGHASIIEALGKKDISNLKSGDIKKAIKYGDQLVKNIVEDAARVTGLVIANLINIFDPEAVVLGGGVIHALHDVMMPLIVKTARDYLFKGFPAKVDIMATNLGDMAGITGAAAIAMASKGSKS